MTESEQFATVLASRFPTHGFAWKVLGVIYLESNRFKQALDNARRAVELLPNDAAVFNNLGNIYFKLERFEEAECNFRKALTIAPEYAKALFNLASLLRFNHKLDESEDCCRRALAVEPAYTNAHIALGYTLELQARLPEAHASYKAALALAPDMAALHTDMLHLMSLDVEVTQEQLFAEHLAFGDHFEAPYRGKSQNFANIKDPDRQLRIGFVTGDLNNHALANYLEPLFEFLVQKPLLALHIYYTKSLEDEVTRRFKAHLPIWNLVGDLSEDELASKIRVDGIDILIDLAGHTVLNRLMTFARKPAPVQVSWLGYLGTTGLQAMDYFVADTFWIPPGQLDWQFTEKIAYLPAAMVFQPNAHASAINELPALTAGKITFGSFNRHNKINDAVIVLWSMLMHKVPDSCMVLVAIPTEFQERVIHGFEQAGVERHRLTFFGRTSQVDYLTLHHHVDFCLDTYPHGGGATTAHAAWMGVPTLCLIGDTPASRFGATEMHHLGLDGFIATSIEEFVEKGCYWAANTEELSTLRQSMRIRFNESALGQHRAFSDNFEAMLRAMWSGWCNDLPIESLQIEPVNENPAHQPSASPLEPTSRELDSLQALHHQRQFKEAEKLARQLVSQYPEHGFAWKILGSVLHELGQREESLALQIKITEMRPDDHEAHFNLACEYQQQGKLDD
ncbi:MAG: tetratricopeptide repeat protein, partial [Rhodoferax sp.]|nr:tetratricopeptide repeat protein [Rhodoferax sp.]